MVLLLLNGSTFFSFFSNFSFLNRFPLQLSFSSSLLSTPIFPIIFVFLWITLIIVVFKPPPPVGDGGGYMFSGRPSVRASVRASVRDSRGSLFPQYLQYLLTDFRQTFVTGASRDRDELILDFGVKRSKFKVTAWPNASQIFMFPRYLQYLLTDFRQTFVADASRDRDDLITFLGQKVKVQGHAIAAEAHSTRRYRRVQQHSTLPSSATFSSFFLFFSFSFFINFSSYAL